MLLVTQEIPRVLGALFQEARGKDQIYFSYTMDYQPFSPYYITIVRTTEKVRTLIFYLAALMLFG